MFTGLIEGLGQVEKLEPGGGEVKIWIIPPWPIRETGMGESVAVNGACLTVNQKGERAFGAYISGESLSRTGLGRLRPGSRVNLERAMPLNGRLGGHLVSGHVDCLGRIEEISARGASTRLTVSLPREHMRYVAEKGSIAIDGVSLTVNQAGEESFSVNIIPHTMKETALQLVNSGQYVNIETDLLAKYVEKLLRPGTAPEGGITFEQLTRLGF
ncbi:MAG: riboflavin synthase [Desulfarculales bacterium]|nr:riboflavin synthase [Desulfarculales bacterium]